MELIEGTTKVTVYHKGLMRSEYRGSMYVYETLGIWDGELEVCGEKYVAVKLSIGEERTLIKAADISHIKAEQPKEVTNENQS